MASFTYDAINAQGILLSGEIHAADLDRCDASSCAPAACCRRR